MIITLKGADFSASNIGMVPVVVACGADFAAPIDKSEFDFSVPNTRCYGFPGSSSTSYIMTSAIPVEIGATYEVSTECRFIGLSDTLEELDNSSATESFTLLNNTTTFQATHAYCTLTISASSENVNTWTLRKVKNSSYKVVAKGEDYSEPVEYSAFDATIPNTRCYGYPSHSSTTYIMTSAIPLEIGATYKLSTEARFVILADTRASTSLEDGGTKLDKVTTFTADKAFCSITISASSENVNTWTLTRIAEV